MSMYLEVFEAVAGPYITTSSSSLHLEACPSISAISTTSSFWRTSRQAAWVNVSSALQVEIAWGRCFPPFCMGRVVRMHSDRPLPAYDILEDHFPAASRLRSGCNASLRTSTLLFFSHLRRRVNKYAGSPCSPYACRPRWTVTRCSYFKLSPPQHYSIDWSTAKLRSGRAPWSVLTPSQPRFNRTQCRVSTS
ncbi:hypothetical protein K466DRAFT_218407 [Polyporus arcularius HHB13444]|uniref:Uncharacterized protein n=1 Tax=Polyporus arcularius HHB13444 TaxID=1314778 RepID=A0A5C3PXE6_9APHY|nr:hypothetical protein K466DRAFT_218407 [Polyporus arcularius HHB13444]